MADKNWVLREGPDSNFGQIFPEEPEIVRRLLWRQNITTPEEAAVFLSPDYDRDVHDPFLLKDMDKAVERISRAIADNQKIIIFGDYDADGICGSVVFYDFLRAIGYQNFENYIPHRYTEGYGLGMERVEDFAKGGAKLLITIDCGVTNYEEIERAQALGIDVIVIDHHIVPPKWPPAYAIIDYKHPDDSYPSKYLSGAGLAFKVVQGVLLTGSWPVPLQWSKWLLDAVAIAAVADMVPLLGENRTLVHYGLKVLAKSRRPGLKELFRISRIGGSVTTDTIGFTVGPRINAASRMGHARTAFEFLTTESSQEAGWLAGKLEFQNEERKRLVEEIIRDARSDAASLDSSLPVLYLGRKEWLPGVLGIVANRLMEDSGKPVFLWGASAPGEYSPEMKHLKGSCRSVPGLNAVEIMRSCKDYLLDFGGHQAAGGFSLQEETASDFGKVLVEAVLKMQEHAAEDSLVLDAELELPEATWDAFQIIERFQPFGQENKKPVFWIKRAQVSYASLFGASRNHLRFECIQPGSPKISALKFSAPREWLEMVRRGAEVDIAASFDCNEWNGGRELRLRVEDIRLC